MSEKADDDTTLLKAFKERMNIFHDTEDDKIEIMLEASKTAIKSMVSSDDVARPDVKELVIERTRYTYNDSVEFFEDTFQSRILSVAFDVLNEVSEDDSK